MKKYLTMVLTIKLLGIFLFWSVPLETLAKKEKEKQEEKVEKESDGREKRKRKGKKEEEQEEIGRAHV